MTEIILDILFGAFWLLVFMGGCASIAYGAYLATQIIPAMWLGGFGIAAVFLGASWLIGDAVRGS